MVSALSPPTASLPRPPTPPKDSRSDIEEALNFLHVDFTIGKPAAPTRRVSLGTDTPPVSSPPNSQAGSGSRTAKKVEFVPWTVKHEGRLSVDLDGQGHQLKRLPTQNARKPLKSILKSSSGQLLTPDEVGSPSPSYFPSSEPQSFSKMLESAIKMLSSSSQASRTDGYRTLIGALKTYEDLPDIRAVRSKMSQLERLITRDITSKSTEARDMTTTTQALKLSIALLPTSAFSDDFQTLLLDRCIDIMGQDPVSKAVVNHCMCVLAYQSFGTKTMTATKVEQIILRLDTIHTRVTGHSVTGIRLVIYGRLCAQAPTTMLAKVRDWLKHIFHGVLSSNKEVRQRAVECGLRAGSELGTNHSVTKAIVDLFATEIKDGGNYGNYLIARLSDMIDNTETSPDAAQIWGMVVLFFRSGKRRISQWQMFKPWLLVIQRCLNSGDLATKSEATIAWNRLVFSVGLNQTALNPKDQIVPMLRVPFLVAFDKKEQNDKPSRDARRIAQGGYCNLLYYALQPSQSFEELDAFWDEYVGTILPKMLRSRGKDAKFAFRVLRALFRGRNIRWDLNRANMPKRMVPEDLPRLDSKWLRLRLGKILDMLVPCFEVCLWLSDSSYEDPGSTWTDLMTAVAEAGSQEVRASMELRGALAYLMNFFAKLWQTAGKSPRKDDKDTWVFTFATLLTTSIEHLGPSNFSEESLARSQTNELEAAPTPSHRPSKHHGNLQSPLAFLYGLFARPSFSSMNTDEYYAMATKVLQIVSGSCASQEAKLVLLQQCIPKKLGVGTEGFQPLVAHDLWRILATETVSTLAGEASAKAIPERERLGHLAHQTIGIFSAGFFYNDNSKHALSIVSSLGFEIYHALFKRLRHEAGDGAVVIGLMEPFAAVLRQNNPALNPATLLEFTSLIASESVWPRSRQQLDEGRKSLWGRPSTSARSSTFEPFDHVYSLINLALSGVNADIDECQQGLSSLVQGLNQFLTRCPPSLATTALRRTQDGLSILIRDKDQLISSTSSGGKETAAQVLSLWKLILSFVRASPPSSRLLEGLVDLFAAGFCSTRRAIVNETIIAWNETFGQFETLEYPQEIVSILNHLREAAELDLPNFPACDNAESDISVPFLSLQEDSLSEDDATPRPHKREQDEPHSTVKPAHHSAFFTRTAAVNPSSTKQSATPGASKLSPVKSAPPTARLRHDDSQIQFTTVESSPVASTEVESQNLTDHQKEVIARQVEENSKRYLEFSSSPIQWPATPLSGLQCPSSRIFNLDFGHGNRDGRVKATTPEHLNEEDAEPMDDFLGSSPTPRTAEKPRAQREISGEGAVTDERSAREESAEQDVPSSPPRPENDIEEPYGSGRPKHQSTQQVLQDDQVIPSRSALLYQLPQSGEIQELQDQTTCLELTEDKATEAVNGGPAAESYAVSASHAAVDAKNADSQVGESSDVVQNNSGLEGTTEISSDTKDVPDGIQSDCSSPIRFVDTNEDDGSSGLDAHFAASATRDNLGTGDGTHEADNSAVKETLIDSSSQRSAEQQGLAETQTDHPMVPVSPERPINKKQHWSDSKKRKRPSSSTPSSQTKRQKHISPVKKFFSRLLGSQSQEEEPEDIQDCIVVNMRPSQEEDAMASPDTEIELYSESFTEQVPELEPRPKPEEERHVSPPMTMEPPKPKRGRGRPRKSTTPVADSPAPLSQTRGSKRRASALDNVAMEETEATQDSQPIPAGEPVQRKIRKGRRSQDVTTATITSQDDSSVVEDRHSRRLSGVVIPTVDMSASEHDSYESEASAVISPEKQLRLEQEAATIRADRVIARPRSILDRLRSIWDEIKSSVMSSQEEREADDLLFEIKKEVHEASRRWRPE